MSIATDLRDALSEEFDVPIVINPETILVPSVSIEAGEPIYTELVMGEEVEWAYVVTAYASILDDDLGETAIRDMASRVRTALQSGRFETVGVSGIIASSDEGDPTYAAVETQVTVLEYET